MPKKFSSSVQVFYPKYSREEIDRFFRVIQKTLGEVIKDPVDFEYHSSSMTLGLSLLQTHLPTLLHLG